VCEGRGLGGGGAAQWRAGRGRWWTSCGAGQAGAHARRHMNEAGGWGYTHGGNQKGSGVLGVCVAGRCRVPMRAALPVHSLLGQ
jgi:hypothetical protein